MARCWTSGEVCRLLEIREWRLAYLYRNKRLPEPSRLGNRRCFGATEVAAISAELTRANVPHRRPEAPLIETFAELVGAVPGPN